jgi:hypothetical protein
VSEAVATEPKPVPVGEALDALVALRVMGWTHLRKGPVNNRTTGPVPFGRSLVGRPPRATVGEAYVPPYSTDRAAALDVFFEMVTRTGHGELICDMEDYGREPGDIVLVSFGFDDPGTDVWCGSGELPEAICRLALTIVETVEGERA